MKTTIALSLYIAITMVALLLHNKPKATVVETNYLTVLPINYTYFEPVDMPTKATLTKTQVNAAIETDYALPYGLLELQHRKETSGRCNISSRAGASGCFQFMPITIRHINIRYNYKFDPTNYKQSAKAAALYLNEMKSRFTKYKFTDEVLWCLTLAAYNATPSKATQWAELAKQQQVTTVSDLVPIINWKETRNYVDMIGHQLYASN